MYTVTLGLLTSTIPLLAEENMLAPNVPAV